jgi:hypothetical protein
MMMGRVHPGWWRLLIFCNSSSCMCLCCITGVVMLAMANVRCGWIQHEGGHNSLTTIPKVISWGHPLGGVKQCNSLIFHIQVSQSLELLSRQHMCTHNRCRHRAVQNTQHARMHFLCQQPLSQR